MKTFVKKTCPHCLQKVEVPEDSLGKPTSCPVCLKNFTPAGKEGNIGLIFFGCVLLLLMVALSIQIGRNGLFYGLMMMGFSLALFNFFRSGNEQRSAQERLIGVIFGVSIALMAVLFLIYFAVAK
jgi:hypothetical protein